MNFGEIMKMLVPVLIACIAWLLGQVSSFQSRLIKIESQMPILITEEGVIIDSPQSAERRQIIKEELLTKIYDLHVRVKMLEQMENAK